MATAARVKCRAALAPPLLALLSGLGVAPLPAQAEHCDHHVTMPAVGRSAIDGDTFSTADGREWRLAGVLAPKRGDGARLPARDETDTRERGDRPRASPADAAKVALEALILGQDLRLAAMGEAADRHGRRLVVVYDAQCTPIAARLLAAGHVRVYPTVATRGLAAALYASEATARGALRGLWSDPRYRVLKVHETAGRFDSYVVVEGLPTAALVSRSATQLMFGPDRARDFGVAIEAKVRKLMPPTGLDPGGLVGRPIRVRGWLRERSGAPVIDLVVPEQVEVVEP